jgi:hypothetical protein
VGFAPFGPIRSLSRSGRSHYGSTRRRSHRTCTATAVASPHTTRGGAARRFHPLVTCASVLNRRSRSTRNATCNMQRAASYISLHDTSRIGPAIHSGLRRSATKRGAATGRPCAQLRFGIAQRTTLAMHATCHPCITVQHSVEAHLGWPMARPCRAGLSHIWSMRSLLSEWSVGCDFAAAIRECRTEWSLTQQQGRSQSCMRE